MLCVKTLVHYKVLLCLGPHGLPESWFYGNRGGPQELTPQRISRYREIVFLYFSLIVFVVLGFAAELWSCDNSTLSCPVLGVSAVPGMLLYVVPQSAIHTEDYFPFIRALQV